MIKNKRGDTHPGQDAAPSDVAFMRPIDPGLEFRGIGSSVNGSVHGVGLTCTD